MINKDYVRAALEAADTDELNLVRRNKELLAQLESIQAQFFAVLAEQEAIIERAREVLAESVQRVERIKR